MHSHIPDFKTLENSDKNFRPIILHEDFATECHAHYFLKSLIASSGGECDLSPSLWPVSALNIPIIATELREDISRCDCFILVLRGNIGLTTEIKRWILQLNTKSIILITLLDPRHCDQRAMAAIWAYLKKSATHVVASYYSFTHHKWQTWLPEASESRPTISIPEYQMVA